MPSIVVYYKQTRDPDTFEKRYLEEHLRIVDQEWKGVTRRSFSRVANTVVGEFPYTHVFVAEFASADDMNAHLTSDTMKKSAEHAMEISDGFDAVLVDTLG